jgi:Tfp pilus assembly PilM family ATPase
MNLLNAWLASPPPDAAIEIAADRMTAVAVATRAEGLVVSAYASHPLGVGFVTPSLTETNVRNRSEAVRVAQYVLEKLGTRPRRVALVIPDTVTKVSLLRFDKVPQRRDDFEQLVRWQLRKAAPFSIDTALVSTSPGLPTGEGREFLVELAREEAIREYESVCEEAGVYAGIVETATLGLLGMLPAGAEDGRDWLLVHVRPDYTTIVIMRGDAVIFHRNRAEDGEEGLPDLVHQTAMYYQDRLSGEGFARVMLAGGGRGAAAVDMTRRALEERLGGTVEVLDPTQIASLTDRISTTPELMDVLGPAVGILARERTQMVRA